MRQLLESLGPALSEPGLRQLMELSEAPEPPEGSRVAHPAVRLASLLLLDAQRRGASDILAVPASWCGLVQYRLGGALVPVLELGNSYHRALVARLKTLAGLDLSQRRRPQEGESKPDADTDGPRAIVRVLPTVYGERVDVHLEGPPKTALQPAELGMPKPELDR
jgi:type IV pilus assembly protein PilB